MKSAEFIQSVANLEELPNTDKPQIAVIGRSNVGKSSFINHFTGKKGLANVSATAGRTQTINLFKIDNRFFLVDLPGYGFTHMKSKRAVFANLILDYLAQTAPLKLVFVLIDANVGPTDLDIEMFKFLRSNKIPLAIIANKIDKLSKNQAAAFLNKLAEKNPETKTLGHSMNTNASLSEISAIINEAIA